jgi:hypothetical protein
MAITMLDDTVSVAEIIKCRMKWTCHQEWWVNENRERDGCCIFRSNSARRAYEMLLLKRVSTAPKIWNRYFHIQVTATLSWVSAWKDELLSSYIYIYIYIYTYLWNASERSHKCKLGIRMPYVRTRAQRSETLWSVVILLSTTREDAGIVT